MDKQYYDANYYTPQEVAEEFAVVAPSVWNKHTGAKRAKLVTKVWIRDYLPTLKAVIEVRRQKAKGKRDQEAAANAAKIDKRRQRHQAMNKLVLKAMDFYGDCCYEYAQQLWSEEGPELMTSGAKEFSSDDEDMLMGEAIYAAFAGSISTNAFDQIKAYWKKYYR